MERHFEQQLEKLKTRLIKMCSLVEEQVEFAIKAVMEDNDEIATLVVDRDKKVDKYDLKVDKICMKLFALQQPVAMDLRLIMSALTINNNLERMGDLATKIARIVKHIKNQRDVLDAVEFEKVSKSAHEMVRLSIDSFVDVNPNLARKVLEMDDDLDEMVKQNTVKLIQIMKNDPNKIESALYIDRILQSLERLGDHSTNIAENVYFIAEAEMIKHRYEEFKAKIAANEQTNSDDEISEDSDE